MSGQITRNNRVLVGKLESTYGVDANPTGALNAIRVTDLSIKPVLGNQKRINYIRGFLGIGRNVRTELYRSITFKVDMVSALTPGQAPPYGFILRACGMAETLLAAAVTGTLQAGSTATTLKLPAAASAINGAYIGAKSRITGGLGSGQAASGIAYDGVSKILTLDRPLATVPDGTSAVSIDPFARYNPISDLGTMEAATFYYYTGNKVRHKLLGCRGNAKWDASSKDTGFIEFEMFGLYGGVADASEASVVTTNWVDPWEVGFGRTYGQFFGKQFTGGATGLQMGKFSLDLGHKPKYRSVVGFQGINSTDRESTGSITLDATLVAEQDIWAIVTGSTTGAIGIEQPDTNNGSVRLDVPKADPTDADDGDDEGISINNIPFDCMPVLGNDDFYYTCR